MHLTGFEPVMFLRKRIMSPVPSTTRPQMRNMIDIPNIIKIHNKS